MYCPSCGEEVDTFLMLVEDEEQHHCFVCSSPLSQERSAAGGFKPLDSILVAEDSAVFREVLRDKLTEKDLTKNAVMAGNGEEFLTIFTNRLYRNQPISLCILDIRMPVFNGVNAAMALRSIEKGFERTRKIPILFFSSVKCDEQLREILKFTAPSRYINKGASDSPDELADRLLDVVQRLLLESGSKSLGSGRK
jgi:CheY-like chemotaxis protein